MFDESALVEKARAKANIQRMDGSGAATANTPKSTMDATHAHATVNGAGDHAGMRRTDWRAEMRAGEVRPRKARTGDAVRRHSRAIGDRRRAAEDLHG